MARELHLPTELLDALSEVIASTPEVQRLFRVYFLGNKDTGALDISQPLNLQLREAVLTQPDAEPVPLAAAKTEG